MKPTYRRPGRVWRKMTVLVLMLLPLISMTGCSARYVVVQGEETINVKKSTLDNLYSDNERLLKAVEQCRAGKP